MGRGIWSKKSFLKIFKLKKIKVLNSIFDKQYDLKDINKLIRDFSKVKFLNQL